MYEELIKKITEKSGMDINAIEVKIQEKKKEFSNLISDEGAAHILAKEMGISIEKKRKPLYIESLVSGIQNLTINAKIMRIFPTREFNTPKASGKVANIILADNTGSLRMTLWNDEIKLIENMKEGDVIEIKGFTKEGYDGAPELGIGKQGSIETSNEEIDVKDDYMKPKRCKIKDVKENQNVEIRSCILKSFDSLFYYSCSQCGAKLKKDNPVCEEHKEAAPDYDIFISCIIDDGTESIRAIMFKEQAEKVLDMKKEDAKKIFDESKNISHVLENITLGHDMVFTGKIRKNDYFKNLEFFVNKVEDIDIKKEIENLMN